ncbi:hypothetical protein [Natronosalvus vescus]|uniref:hypothetical protein n=1 Tax=Natronosalvus vescus TaxID=2953881 RepID=UPI0020904A52|nr:hypothetical protein [Natronosalvus vescus]
MEISHEKLEKNIVKTLIGAFVLLLIIASLVNTIMAPGWLTVLNLSISGVLTMALVLLYYNQTDLLEREINREVRQEHSKTLREIVRVWHGDPDILIGDNIHYNSKINFPVIRGGRPLSAIIDRSDDTEDKDEFRVVPKELERNRYLEDLLENHAPDLKEARQNIRSLKEKFESHRNAFDDEFSEIYVDKDTYSVEPGDDLSEWVFEMLVIEVRNDESVVEEEFDSIVWSLVNKEESLYRNNKIGLICTLENEKVIEPYRLKFKDEEEWEAQNGENMNNFNRVKQTAITQLESVVGSNSFDIIKDAASVLDELEDEIFRLDELLLEYEGRPVYPGECEYIMLEENGI